MNRLIRELNDRSFQTTGWDQRPFERNRRNRSETRNGAAVSGVTPRILPVRGMGSVGVQPGELRPGSGSNPLCVTNYERCAPERAVRQDPSRVQIRRIHGLNIGLFIDVLKRDVLHVPLNLIRFRMRAVYLP